MKLSTLKYGTKLRQKQENNKVFLAHFQDTRLCYIRVKINYIANADLLGRQSLDLEKYSFKKQAHKNSGLLLENR